MKPSARSELDGRLTDRDIRILEDLERFRLLTTRQVQRLHMPALPRGSHRTVNGATRAASRVLARLETHRAVGRLERRVGGVKHGSALAVWQLGPAGDRFLRAERGEPLRRRYDEPEIPFVDHQLAVADLAVDLIELAHSGRFDLLDLEVEPTCWRPFTGSGGTMVTLKPDLLVVTADQQTETHSFVEVDRGTEHLPAVLRKCLIYQRYAATGIEQQQRALFPAVVWIVPTMSRQKKVREAIRGDPGLDESLFWVTVPEQALAHLAPYETTHPKGGTTT